MLHVWVVFLLALFASSVASAADQVACRQVGQQIIVTATDGNVIYAVNGAARSIAASKGWQDGKMHYEPSELLTLLQRGLSSCSSSASAEPPTAPSKPVAAPTVPASVASTGPLNATVFIKAAAVGNIATLKQYVAAGFNVNTRGPGVPALGITGSPAINEAAAAGQCHALDYLLSAGAKADPKEVKFGFTPVGSAAQAGAVACVRSLIAKGARVDVRDEPGGDTPLIKAAYQGHLDVVKLLVEHGASLKASNKDGDTPYRAAAVMGNNHIAQFLKSKGGS